MTPSHNNSEELQGEGVAEETTSTEKGLCLVEVFNIIYKGHDEIKPEKQIGIIKVNDDVKDHYLYKVENIDASRPTIQLIDEIVLTGPSISSISAEKYSTFDVDLFDGAFKDKLLIKCCSSSSSSSDDDDDPITSDDLVDKCAALERVIVSKDGKGEIYIMYAIYHNAVEAHLEIKLLADDDFPTDVYGYIVAATSKTELPEYSSILFAKRHDNKIKVGPSELLPLSRSIVAVPLECEFFVDIWLMTGARNAIFEETVSFLPERTSTHTEVVSGKKCKIEVKVTWKCGE